jgi:uncharacterized protein (TIGR02145 family)
MKSLFTFVFFAFVAAFIGGCKKNKEIFPPTAVMYPNKTQVGIGTATLQAGFSGLEITERGICWGTNQDPSTSGPYVKSGSGEGNIVEVITGLTSGSVFFARAYAINKGGTTYSEPVSFVVSKPPHLTTGPVSARTTSTAVITVQVAPFDLSASASFGICYATHAGPVVEDGSTELIPYNGNYYTQTISGLSAGTTYFARAYVKLPGGTFFGNEITFNTYSGTIFDIDGNAYYTIKIGSQEWMVSNLRTTRYQDGTLIPSVSLANWVSHTGDARAVNADQESYAVAFGRYYNREAAVNLHGLAPAGWRVPSRADWQQLFNFAGVDSAAIRLISTQWQGAQGDNRYGFTVMPAGMRQPTGQDVNFNTANFWTTTLESGYFQTVRFGETFYDFIPYSSNNQPGLCVRCIKE